MHARPTSLDSFLSKWERLSRKDAFPHGSARAWRDGARKTLSEILGLGLLEKPESLEPEKLSSEPWHEGATLERWTILVEEDVSMPFCVLRPGKPNGRALVCAPGHLGGGKESLIGNREDPRVAEKIDFYNYDYALRAAALGFTTFAHDPRGFGERLEEGDCDILSSSCRRIAHMAAPLGLSLAGLLVWDIMRLVDHVTENEGFGDVGILGFSGGGLQALCAGALDTRLKLVFTSGYFYGFRDSLLVLNANCECNYVSSLWRHFDVQDLAAMVAPRPMVVQSAEGDHLAGPRGLENVIPQVAEARLAWEEEGVPGLLVHDIIPGGHHFGPERLRELLGA